MNTNQPLSHQFFGGLLKYIMLVRQDTSHQQPDVNINPNIMLQNIDGAIIKSNNGSHPPNVTKIIIMQNENNSVSYQENISANSNTMDLDQNSLHSPKQGQRRAHQDIISNDTRASQMFNNSFIQYNSTFELDSFEPQRKKSSPPLPNNVSNTFVIW